MWKFRRLVSGAEIRTLNRDGPSITNKPGLPPLDMLTT